MRQVCFQQFVLEKLLLYWNKTIVLRLWLSWLLLTKQNIESTIYAEIFVKIKDEAIFILHTICSIDILNNILTRVKFEAN